MGNANCLCGGTGETDQFRPGRPYPCPECQSGPLPAGVRAAMEVDNAIHTVRVRGGNCVVVLIALLSAPAAVVWSVIEWLS